MLKRIVWGISCLALLSVLAACGSKADEPASAAASASPAAAGQTAAAEGAQLVTIKASNWKFDQTEYKVKKGQPVTLKLENAEGVHGLEVQKLNVKLDNKNASKTFTPDKAGKYTIVCTIPCGSDHLKMKSTLIVEE
ncbi:cupredoxin domain-containing protein [Gorillibacterium sp. sgz5001074]|uniref:cupredoxin domain-containing protein n=1 Tax=Gorillibacterium sp. sgz5001074 TaxID=3446695 RepID=UPI003F668C38